MKRRHWHRSLQFWCWRNLLNSCWKEIYTICSSDKAFNQLLLQKTFSQLTPMNRWNRFKMKPSLQMPFGWHPGTRNGLSLSRKSKSWSPSAQLKWEVNQEQGQSKSVSYSKRTTAKWAAFGVRKLVLHCLLELVPKLNSLTGFSSLNAPSVTRKACTICENDE